MTTRQVELLTLLNECAPVTCNAIYNIWMHTKGMAFSSIGNCLRALEKLGWVVGILTTEIEICRFVRSACVLRDRKLWAITWCGYHALQKELSAD